MKRLVGFLVIIVGLGLVFNKSIVNFSIGLRVDKANREFKTRDLGQARKAVEDSVSYDFDKVDDINPSKVYLELNEEDYDQLMGQVVIPSLDINVVLFEGISDSKLLKGVSTMKPGQVMGQGNFSIAGHYGIRGELFHSLDQAKIGDEIRLTDREKIYIYRVYDEKLVDPEDIYMIEDRQAEKFGGPIISLMSCKYENGKNTGQRLFLLGSLEKVIDYREDIMETSLSY